MRRTDKAVNGSDVDFRARAARGHSAAGPVRGPGCRTHLALDSGGRLPVSGAGSWSPCIAWIAGCGCARSSIRPTWAGSGRHRRPGGAPAPAQGNSTSSASSSCFASCEGRRPRCPDGVIILSAQREIVWFNRQAARLLGLRRPVDVGLRIDNLIRSPEFVLYLHGDDYAMPLVIRPPAALDQYLALQVVPYGGGQSLLLVRDVTRQMRLEAMRKDFVANASHELRTPLTVISGYLDTLADDSSPSIRAWSGPIRDMRAQAQRMNTIIADLLELSRLESTDGEAPRDAVDVPKMLERLHRDALAQRRPAAPGDSESGVHGRPVRLGERTGVRLHQSVGERHEVHAPPRARCGCAWWVDEDAAYFSVIDSGIGIPAEHIPRLTRALLPGGRGTVPRTGGVGPGIGHRQACPCSAMAAGWRCKAREGRGSTFTCPIPAGANLEAGRCEPRKAPEVTIFGRGVDGRCNRM